MNREEIKQFLPHREPMLLVDSVDLDEANIAHALYHVRGDEYFLQGHFPGNPVVPGVILCEMMAQASGLCLKELLIGRTPFYAGIDNVRFKRQVKPGDTIVITAKVVKQRALIFFVEAKAEVEGEICTQGNLTFALVDNDKIGNQ
jgi:3-hydroxyacyl-[acyl-carrier-protein] dehydratase